MVKKKPLGDVDHLVFFGLTCFAINENLSAVKAESLVWQESTYTLGPNLRRKYDLEYDHITSSLYLVWAALSPPKFSILAYKIDPTGSTTAKLGGFYPNGYATQPPESEREKPFDENFTKEYNISKDWCQPEGSISIVVERDSILLSATQFEERNCPPSYFRLDFHTKKWKEISYQGK